VALLRLRRELRLLNKSAVKSLDEALEETLTLHRLGVFRELGISLKTTNCRESLNSLVGQRVARVDRLRTSDQKQCWLAAALLDIEPRLRRIQGLPCAAPAPRRFGAGAPPRGGNFLGCSGCLNPCGDPLRKFNYNSIDSTG